MSSFFKKIKAQDGSVLFLDIIKYLLIGIFVIACVYPFYYVVIYSISDPSRAAEGIYLLPKGFNLTTYKKLLGDGDMAHAFFISIARTVLGTGLCVLCTSMLAFLVTRKEMWGRKFVYRFVVISMYLNAGIVPWYLVMKAYGLDNNFLLYILPGSINAYYMILIKTFMEQIPESMEESAALEGAGFFSIFFKIIMPLSKPILATVAVYCAVNQWNQWMDNFFLVHDRKLQTVQLILYNYLNSAESVAKSMKGGASTAMMAANAATSITPQSVQMTSIVVTVIPIILVYPFAQKYFTKGIMMGAVKG